MIVLKLRGALGNQLFSYCFARSLSIRKKQKILIDKAPIYRYESASYYSLNKFKTKAILLPFGVKYIKSFCKLFSKDLVDIEAVTSGILFSPEKLELAMDAENIVIDGHWQSYRYFEKEWERFKEELEIKEEFDSYRKGIISDMKSCDSVSVHVRRGDYTKVKSLDPLDMEYYKKAHKVIREKCKNPKYFIFTDDIDWVKENFPLENVIYVNQDIEHPHKDLALMSKSKHNIIANSTYSWWGAWLNTNRGKVVVAPKNWFVNESLNSQIKDLIPDNWILI